MSKLQVEVDCTRRCKSRRHGQSLTSAITKRSVSDESLASFIKGTCINFTQAFDFEGRTSLHMAASRGRKHLTEWLIKHSTEAFINARDRESGYTPLHRSIFYGQIHSAVMFMKIGVNTNIVDKDDYNALEHAALDRQYMYKHDGTQPYDVYVWGANSNYTLGTGTQQQRKTPDILNCFSRANTSVKQVCLGKFHSAWLCEGGAAGAAGAGGEVWACGQLARAGGSGATALRPAPLRLPEPCVQMALTLNSTIFLLQSGTVIQYGPNDADVSGQSNVKPPPAKPLLKLSRAGGVCASRVHAVAWGARAAYAWGADRGQLGHGAPAAPAAPAGGHVAVPKKVAISMSEDVTLQLAAAADAATVLTTSRGDVYLLHRHMCKKIAIKQINLKQVCVDAKVNEQGVYSRVTVLLLTNVGQMLVWQDSTNALTRCIFGLNHQTIITHATLTYDAVYFTTKYGEAYVGVISRKSGTAAPQPPKKEKDSNKSALVKFLEKDDCTPVKITRIPNVHRAVSIAVDGEGLNFACLQIKPTCGLTSLPELSPTCLPKHMETLIETAADDDILHDVVFKIGTKLYPAHIFIVASGSELLYKLYQDKKQLDADELPTITLENVHPEVFDRILKYLYTGSCDVAQLGACNLKIRREDLIGAVKKEKENIDNDVDLIENGMETSAFEVYKNQNDKKKRNSKNRQKPNEPVRTHLFCDPVKLVQAAAKRLQVLSLHKLLDKFYYRDGHVLLKESATLPKPAPLTWDRDTFPELVDTNVCTKDGFMISAHKCVLAARLEYFYGMFMHSWTESKIKGTVTLPVNHGVLLPIINFLYTDCCPDVENADSIDFICSLLIVADQLFIIRLKEMCEMALANLITLKNSTELCQFAHTFNALQLKQCCMEFISLNITSFLESRSLENLDDDLLEDITNYYCNFNPIMSSRVITPFYNAPSDELVNEMYKRYPVDLNVTDEELKNETVEVTKRKNKSSKKIEYTESEKARMRYESVSSITSLDLSNENTGDITLSLSKIAKDSDKETVDQNKWIKVSTSQDKQQKVVQARLKAISSAKDILKETPVESFTKLTKSTFVIESSPPNTPTTSQNDILVSPKMEYTADIAKSPQGNIIINHVGPKLSQKQRKKLAMQGDLGSPQSFGDFFPNKLPLVDPLTKPKNPWKISEIPIASIPNKKSLEFNQILADQRKQKDDSSRIMTKPLNLTQLEDKAIEELERFYNIHEVDDELISVRRIELQVSSPQWIHTTPK